MDIMSAQWLLYAWRYYVVQWLLYRQVLLVPIVVPHIYYTDMYDLKVGRPEKSQDSIHMCTAFLYVQDDRV